MAPAVINDGNVVYEVPATKGAKNIKSAAPVKSAVLHRTLHHDPLNIVSASGLYLHTSNGQKILDATGGAAVSCLGHGNEDVRKAMNKQMDEVAYCHSLFFGTSGGEALARELVDGTDGKMSRAFIVSSGSEAMEATMKLARQYYTELSPAQPQRINFIARKGSYHGATLGALSLGGHVARRALFEPMLMKTVSRVSPCNEYRDKLEGESTEQYVARLAQELDDEFQRVGPDTVCAFVAEPVVGAALGCVPNVPGYFEAISKVCKKYGALLVFDEIMSGVGRCGTLHAWQHPSVGVSPDIQSIGKGLGGGYAPIAAILLSPRVVEALEKGSGAFSHGQTYQGHPISCAAAAEVQSIIKREGLVANVARMGEKLEQGLKARLSSHPNVGNIRGRGLFWGIELVKDKATKEAFDPKEAIAMGIHELGMASEYGISLYPGSGTVDGVKGDHVILSPAYTITEDDVATIVRLAASVIEDFFERKNGSGN